MKPAEKDSKFCRKQNTEFWYLSRYLSTALLRCVVGHAGGEREGNKKG